MSRKSRTSELSQIIDLTGVKLPRVELSMRWSIVSLLTLLIVLSASLIVLVSYLGSRQSTQFLIDTLMEDKAYRFIDKSVHFLADAKIIANDLREEALKLNFATQRKEIEAEMRETLESHPYYSNIYLIQGNSALIAHHDQIPKKSSEDLMNEIDDEKEVKKDSLSIKFEMRPINPAAFPWAQKEFIDSKKITPLHKTFSQSQPGFTFCSGPALAQGNAHGAVCIDITLGDLSLYTTSVKVGEHGKAFLADKELNILAVPQENRESAHLAKEVSGKYVLNSITQFPSVELQTANLAMNKKLKKLQKNKKWMKNKKPFYFDFKIERNRFVGIFVPFPAYTGVEWQTGVIIPEDEFLFFVKRNTRIVMISSGLLVLFAVIMGYIFSQKISKALGDLSEEMHKIQRFELDSKQTIVSSITDVQNMVVSFYKMRQGLRSFRKFVPADVVRQLIAQHTDAELGGEKRTLTIHFSDIEGFTTISESIAPEQLVELLAEYLSEMSRIIGEEQGTVDKYIGDAVMAFWGAPNDVKDHAHRAARAALRCQAKLAELEKKWQSEGKPVFRARIGLNTGEVIVGNIGSAERLNYTVIGDAVNLASRLEGINKYYGTRIIVGETTQKLIHNEFATRLIDFVAVKGKHEAIKIYELICEKDRLEKNEEEFIALFESGIEAYRKQEWNSAEQSIRAAQKIRSDEACTLFLERIQEFREHPPGNDWSGEYVMKSK